MEDTSSNRGGAKPGIRFDFSWADEVEREEREQQEEERRWATEKEQQIKADPFGLARPREAEQRRRETERQLQQTKADPFGAARPREVVLAEKGVDWRARDRELDLHLRTAPRPRPRRTHNHAAATAATSKGAVVAANGATLREQERTPHPRGRRATASTPLPPPPTAVSHSAWGGSKRKCAGEGPAGPSRRVRQVDDQRRKVFGELNDGEGCGSSIRASNNKGCESGGNQAQGIKSSMPPAVTDGENRCSIVPATKVTASEAGESVVAQKRRGGKRRNGRSKKKSANQQTLVR